MIKRHLKDVAILQTHKKLSFPLRISSVNVNKSAVPSHLLKKSLMEKTHFLYNASYIKINAL